MNAHRSKGDSKSVAQLITTRIGASSYIYQPWFATVTAGLGWTVGRSRETREDEMLQGPFGTDQSAPTTQFLTGNARIDVFPRSRFPFEAHFERSDSRVDSALSSAVAFTSQNLGFSQRYRPAVGNYSASGSFDRREQFGSGFRDAQNVLQGDFSTKWRDNDLSLGLTHNDARRKGGDERTQFRSLFGRHQYSPTATALSVNTSLNLTQTKQSAEFADMDLSVLQASSVGLWRPAGTRLTLSSSARALLLRDDADDTEARSLGFTLGAAYEINKNAQINANGNYTASDSNGTRVQSLGGAMGASYQSDSIVIKDYHYNWFATGNAGGSAARSSLDDADGQTVSLSAQLGHTVSRVWPLTPQSGLSLNAGQTLSLSHNKSSDRLSDVTESQRLLLHNAGLGWHINGDNRSAMARLTASDSRELGGGGSGFQMLNFQLSGNFALDRYQTLSGDLTAQRSVQRMGDSRRLVDVGSFDTEPSRSTTVGGEIVYSHQRLFGVPRLRFTSRLKLAQDMQDQPGAFVTIADRETRLWENRLDWRVGRLQAQLIFRISEIDGRRRDNLTLRLQRDFGD